MWNLGGILLALLLASPGFATQINVDIAGSGAYPMAPEETAGADPYRDDYWNALAGTTAAAGPIDLVDGDGTPVVGAQASWTGVGSGDLNDGTGTETDDGHMFVTLYDARNFPAVAVDVTGVPFDRYHVVAYHQGGAPSGLARVAHFQLETATTTQDLFALRPEDFAYTESTATEDQGAATQVGSYVVFRDVTGADFSLLVGGGSASDGFRRARFSGFQIIEVPEPGAAGAAAAGLVELAAARRSGVRPPRAPGRGPRTGRS